MKLRERKGWKKGKKEHFACNEKPGDGNPPNSMIVSGDYKLMLCSYQPHKQYVEKNVRNLLKKWEDFFV